MDDHSKRTRPAFRTRSVTRDGSRFCRLKQLVCYNDVHERVISGWPLSEIARFVQEEKDEYTDIARASLIQILSDYRASLPPGDVVAKKLPAAFTKAVERLDKGIDELEELQKLYRLQMERIAIDYALERNLKKLLNTMTPEIKVARDILETSAQLKMDLGLTTRQIGEVDVHTTSSDDAYGNEAIAKVIDDPKSRRKLLDLVKRFATISQDNAAILPLQEGPILEEKTD